MPTMVNVVLNDGVGDRTYTVQQDGTLSVWNDLTSATPSGRGELSVSTSLAGKGNGRVTDKTALKIVDPREAEVNGIDVVVATDIANVSFVYGPGNTAASRAKLVELVRAALDNAVVTAVVTDLVPTT